MSCPDRCRVVGVCGSTPSSAATLVIWHSCEPGEANCNGRNDFSDIDPFITAMLNPDDFWVACPGCNRMNSDVSGDGLIDFSDIEPFVRCLISCACD